MKTVRVVLGGLLVAAALVGCGDDTATPSATLRILAGTVELAPAGGEFAPATDEMELTAGDTIRTAADGRAEIVFFEDSITRLDFGTTFTLVTLSLDDDGTTIIEADQRTGNTFSRVARLVSARSRFDIETPSAVAGVQGTEYAVLIGADEGETTIVVIEEQVRVTNTAGGETVVEAGFSVIVQRPEISTPGDPVAVPTPTEVLQSDWLVFNQPEG